MEMAEIAVSGHFPLGSRVDVLGRKALFRRGPTDRARDFAGGIGSPNRVIAGEIRHRLPPVGFESPHRDLR